MDTCVSNVDYRHQHPVDDVAELKAIRNVFGDKTTATSSTKSLSGHSLGAAGVQETIYCLLMMKNGFVPTSTTWTKRPKA